LCSILSEHERSCQGPGPLSFHPFVHSFITPPPSFRVGRREREAERQLVRAPVSGRVAEVKVRDLTPRGVTVEVVLVGE